MYNVPCDSVFCLRLVPDFNGRIYKIQRIRFGFVALFKTIRLNRGKRTSKSPHPPKRILCENLKLMKKVKSVQKTGIKHLIFL